MNLPPPIPTDSFSYRRLSEAELSTLHDATLQILEEIGIRFQEPEALSIFQDSGAYVDGDLVRIPRVRVEWALKNTPKQLTLYSQDGKPAINLKGRCAYFGNGSDLLYVIDHRDQQRRRAILQDVVDIMRMLDHLEHIDFVMSGFLPSDVDVDRAETLQMEVMLRYTNKPIMYVSTDLDHAIRAVQMAEVVAGGAQELRDYPFAACYINISNPLRHDPESIKKLIWLSQKGLPFNYRPSLVTRGISTPITPVGYLVVQNAAGLAGLVLSQLVREGTPFIRDANAGGAFDMRYMVGQHATPELRGFNEELLHYYGLPGYGIGGLTGSKVIDSQSAMEAALTLLTSAQAGAHLIHDVGYMDNGMTGSLVQLVICDEIITWIKAYLEPVLINQETLALDAIRKVVETGGDFLGSENTLNHYKEDFYPKFLERRAYHDWAVNAEGILETVSRFVTDYIDEPPVEYLSTKHNKGIQALLEQW